MTQPAPEPSAEYVPENVWNRIGHEIRRVENRVDAIEEVVSGNPGEGPEPTDLLGHILDPTPHPNYDSNTVDYVQLFENGLI